MLYKTKFNKKLNVLDSHQLKHLQTIINIVKANNLKAKTSDDAFEGESEEQYVSHNLDLPILVAEDVLHKEFEACFEFLNGSEFEFEHHIAGLGNGLASYRKQFEELECQAKKHAEIIGSLKKIKTTINNCVQPWEKELVKKIEKHTIKHIQEKYPHIKIDEIGEHFDSDDWGTGEESSTTFVDLKYTFEYIDTNKSFNIFIKNITIAYSNVDSVKVDTFPKSFEQSTMITVSQVDDPHEWKKTKLRIYDFFEEAFALVKKQTFDNFIYPIPAGYDDED